MFAKEIKEPWQPLVLKVSVLQMASTLLIFPTNGQLVNQKASPSLSEHFSLLEPNTGFQQEGRCCQKLTGDSAL